MNKSIITPVSAADLIDLSDETPKESILDKSPDQLVARGFTYLEMGNPELAQLHFTAALQKEPQRSDAFLGLGQVAFRHHNYTYAALHFQKATKLDAGNVSAWIGATRALRRSNKLNEAESTLLRAIAVAPDDLRVLSERAILHDLQGQEELAKPIYHQILARYPKRADTLNNLGVNRLLEHAYGDAIVYFRQALLQDRNNPRIKNNLATAYALNGDEAKAQRLFTDTVGKAAAYNNLGYLYLTVGRLDEAERALRKALEFNPRFYEKAQENLERLNDLRTETD